jgi:hypothetical protein
MNRIISTIKNKPFPIVSSTVLIILFIFHVFGKLKVDGYAITLLILSVFPWSLPALIAIFESTAKAFVGSNLKSIQLGNFKIEQLEKKVEQQAELIVEQRRILDDLIINTMAFYIYDKLKYLHLGTLEKFRDTYGEYRYVKNGTFDHDLRYLRDHGYLELFYLRDLQDGENIVGKLRVTEMGKRFVELKEHI